VVVSVAPSKISSSASEIVAEPIVIDVVKVGAVPKTATPVPVSFVSAAAKFALVGVPHHVAIPEPSEVMPVPPLATGSVPVIPVVRGREVASLRSNAGVASVPPSDSVIPP